MKIHAALTLFVLSSQLIGTKIAWMHTWKKKKLKSFFYFSVLWFTVEGIIGTLTEKWNVWHLLSSATFDFHNVLSNPSPYVLVLLFVMH